MNKRKFFPIFILLALVMSFALPALAADAPPEPPKPALFATWWALVPPVVAIVLALATKEVYSSLFLGIVLAPLCTRAVPSRGQSSTYSTMALLRF